MRFVMKLPLAATALTLDFILALAIQTHAAVPAAATTSGLMLAQAMVPPTGMMDAEHPMPMNERYLRRFPQPAKRKGCRRKAGSEGSVEQKCELMDKNRI
jgi:hypothetical protein